LNGNVVAVGNFGSQAAFGNVAWFDGDTWNGFGAGLGRSSLNPVYCATVYQDELHVGGLFPRPGTPDAMNIAKWDGSQWMEVGGAADAVVTSMVVHQGKLVVGGNFTTIGGVSASRLAEWDGQVWRQLDGGADSVPEALLSGAVELVAGGYFLTVGGKVSPFLASYGCDTCYANCDGSTTAPVVNVADLTCFLQRIAAGDSYANCDNSTTVPTVNVADLTCFLQRFAAGCH
jgi:hypothetical protein